VKDSTPEFEAVEQQIADEEHSHGSIDKRVKGVSVNKSFNGINKSVDGIKANDDTKSQDPIFVKSAVPKPSPTDSRPSDVSSNGDYTCWGDLVIFYF
jgi:hypothetical protein